MAKFHNNRKKDGRDKLFTPESLLQTFYEYVEHTNNSPFLVHEFVGKDGMSVMKAKQRPISVWQFENYVFEKGIAKSLDQYFTNQNGSYNDFLEVTTYITRKCKAETIDGTLAGVYNGNITKALYGLTENIKQTNDGKIEVVFVDNKTIL